MMEDRVELTHQVLSLMYSHVDLSPSSCVSLYVVFSDCVHACGEWCGDSIVEVPGAWCAEAGTRREKTKKSPRYPPLLNHTTASVDPCPPQTSTDTDIGTHDDAFVPICGQTRRAVCTSPPSLSRHFCFVGFSERADIFLLGSGRIMQEIGRQQRPFPLQQPYGSPRR